MSRPNLLILAAAAGFALTPVAFAAQTTAAAASVQSAASPAANLANNPFAQPSPLPFHYPQFDLIKDEHFAPAYAEGMAQNLKEIDAIANNKKPATFDNTIVAMERSGQLLARVSTTFSNLQGANTNDKLDEIDRDMSPKLAAHSDAIYLNGKLYARVKSLYDKRDKLGLDAEAKHLLERYHMDFVRAGAQLSAADKEKLKAYNSELATLQTSFSQSVLKEINASAMIVDTREELAGMSDAAIDAAAAAAKARGMEGKFAVALINTTGQPPLAVLTNPATRKRLMDLSQARGSHGGAFDSRDIVLKIAKLRAEKAALLGYPNYAAYSLADQTAKSTDAVNKLLAELAKPAVANARKEQADLQAVADAEKAGIQVGAADWAFYTDKVRAQRYSFDGAQLKPYFELNNVLEKGVFFAANKLYGLSFKERKDLPVYHPDVKVYDVFDKDGKQLAVFLADMYARPTKQGGAWMNEYVSQSKLLGTQPVVANHLNIPKPPAGEPTLLTVDEVKTAFHEFGHALHGMFSNVKYPRFSGTSVPRDFVEYPSQVNEMWMTNPEVLANYARHYKTGEAMPAALLEKVAAAKKFNQGFATTENVASSLLDQRWHQLPVSQIPTDVLAFEAAALKDVGVDYAPVPPRYRTTYFSHTFSGGYAAGYYSYLWSEKLDADTVEWFKENGGLQRKNGDWFRDKLLSRGGTDDALQLFRNFRGRDAQIEPLLIRRGLLAK
ncbi:M3 family metallopeptidase [Pseudoduganella ginsengisoli]|uniref:Dipeptidyl carboxypeptidase n=1 Tax=Pseudoduganella ginsengisoli TaxID=1462440 RepID=A0A6L6Q8I3_9BURK|nr:M3 family metallopeptidase [Pseudoduganella ginsengisoli]MTW05512.1 dipeptidyl carboxypeptidase II [Pseudoduganella ginsengisoli]